MSSVHPPLAVVGVSAIFPGSTDATGFWRDILAGRDLVGDIPETHWLLDDYHDADPSVPDHTYGSRGAFLGPVDFDAMGFGVPPSVLPTTDTAQLLALIVAKRVLDDATGGQFAQLDREKVSVILGVTSAQELLGDMVARLQHPIWRKSLREMGLPEDQVNEACARISSHYVEWKESTFPGLLGNVVAGRIANRLDLHGTNCVTDAACASTLSALTMAAQELYLGTSDLVITGGVDTMNGIFMHMCFSKTPALSASGDVRPFSDQADGTLLGEGLGMFALRRLEDAERDGDRIYAVLTGIGTSSDGRSKAVYAPVSEGQSRALTRAWQHAGVSPRTVELVEAHGTGTKAGDAAEFGGLVQSFSADSDTEGLAPWCALGSVKSQIGHTKAAAGAAGLFKAIMALHHKVLPPTIKIDRPNPKMDLASSPFYLNTTARPWVRSPNHPRRAGVSSFGFGGSNFHVALEGYEGSLAAGRRRTHPTELVTVSAANPTALATACEALLAEVNEAGDLAYVSWRSAHAAPQGPARVALIARDEDDLKSVLHTVIKTVRANPNSAFELPNGSRFSPVAEQGTTAWIFPGQGSQYLSMGAELAMSYDAAMGPWNAAAHVGFGRGAHAGTPLHDVVFPRGVFSEADREAQADLLRDTAFAQPAIGAVSASHIALLKAMGASPDATAGHSYGELAALYAAGAMDEQTFFSLSAARGVCVAEAAASTEGGMLAVRLTRPQLEAKLSALQGQGVPASDVVIANHNHPEQVVLSGAVSALQAVEAALVADDVVCKRLDVATAFHSSVVAGAVAPFREALSGVTFAATPVPVYADATAAPYGPVQTVAETLATQLTSPVRWVEIIEAMYAQGVRTFVEVGPHTVLTGLVERTLGDRAHTRVAMDRKGRSGLTQLQVAAGALFVSGQDLGLAALWQGYSDPVAPADRPRPKLAVPVDGNNLGKPYPPVGGTAALPKPNPAKPAPEPVVVEKIVEVEKIVHVPVAADAGAPTYRPLPAAAAPAARVAMMAGAPDRTAPAPVGDVWLDAFQTAQHHATEAHAAYQRAMADSHMAWLSTMQGGLQHLASLVGAPGVAASAPVVAAPAAYVPAPAPVFAAPAPAPVVAPTPVVAPAPTRAEVPVLRPPTPAPAPTPVAAPAPLAAPVAAAPAADMTALMLDVVAEKTGYPVEMLSLEMDLEADLGVDSIKRVEILSAVREKAPNLPEVDAGAMASLRTLGEIVDHLGASLPAGSTAPSSAAAVATAAVASAPAADMTALMLDVVAEKTGYPVEMLSLEMDLEADLGVDSIKRVEILSAVREQAPDLPEVDAGAMASLRTLGEIVDHLGASMPAGTTAPAAVAAPVAVAPAADVTALMLDVVADKTGYPVEMLSLEMDLEADLGVDSIKRVEILSAVREKAPDLPEVDAGAMASLRTLGEIVDHLGASLPVAEVMVDDDPAPGGADVTALMLDVVADKTGYPVEMLSLEMDLEADLGVDSIKRVEILSAVREQAPDLPEVDAGAMASLRTLGEIVDHLGASLPAGAVAGGHPVGKTQAPVPTASAVESKTLAQRTHGLQRWTVRAVPAPALGVGMPRIGQGPLLITRDGAGVAEAVATELRTLGMQAKVVDQRGLEHQAGQAAGLICLAGLGPFRGRSQAIQASSRAFLAAKTLAPTLSTQGGVLVTVQDTGGDFGLSGAGVSAWAAGLPGLVKTAVQEWPDASGKAIDIQVGERSAEAVASAIVAELTAGGPEIEVGLFADGQRITLASVPEGAPGGELALPEDAVVVVSGGARGVTAACVQALAATRRLRFVLLGRSPLVDEPAAARGVTGDAALKSALLKDAMARGQKVTPAALGKTVRSLLASREVRQTLEGIAAAGSLARYIPVDVTDAAGLQDALSTVRKDWGDVRGVVHAAGVLADKAIVDKTEEQFQRVFHTKVGGLAALLEATATDPVQAVVLFSSVAARAGNVGQVDYAMANEVLNKVGHQLARSGEVVVRSLGWGPWKGGMVTPALEAHFASRGVPMIPLDAGAACFVEELFDGARGAVERVVGGVVPEGAPKGSSSKGSGLSLGEAKTPSSEVGVQVSARTLPQLDGHRVKGVPVVPVVVAAEWMARAAKAARPDLTLAEILDIEVIAGIRVDDFVGKGTSLVAKARQLQNGNGSVLAVSLEDLSGRLRYRARVRMHDEGGAVGVSVATEPRGAAWSGSTLYDGDVLFHGPDFQVIRDVEQCSDDGVIARLVGLVDQGWGDGPWCTDPAALDGAMQLVVLWAERMLQGASLPTRVQAIRLHRAGPVRGELKAVGLRREVGPDHVVMDVVLLAEDGSPVAELRGVRNVKLTGTRPARDWAASAGRTA